MANKIDINTIKQNIEDLIGQQVRVRANKGRRKIVEREGTLEQTYPSHFLVRLDEASHSRKVSYQYTDLLTETVELMICEPNGERKFEITAS